MKKHFLFQFSLVASALLIGCGGGSSEDANQAPVIGDIADQILSANAEPIVLTAALSDDNDDLSQLQLSALSSDQSVIAESDIGLSVVGGEIEINLSIQQNKLGTSSIQITAADSSGASTNRSFIVDVEAITADFSEVVRDIFAEPADSEPLELSVFNLIEQTEDDFDDLF